MKNATDFVLHDRVVVVAYTNDAGRLVVYRIECPVPMLSYLEEDARHWLDERSMELMGTGGRGIYSVEVEIAVGAAKYDTAGMYAVKTYPDSVRRQWPQEAQ
jgi:hypothetical protein